MLSTRTVSQSTTDSTTQPVYTFYSTSSQAFALQVFGSAYSDRYMCLTPHAGQAPPESQYCLYRDWSHRIVHIHPYGYQTKGLHRLYLGCFIRNIRHVRRVSGHVQVPSSDPYIDRRRMVSSYVHLVSRYSWGCVAFRARFLLSPYQSFTLPGSAIHTGNGS
jgi:hypothetical protein